MGWTTKVWYPAGVGKEFFLLVTVSRLTLGSTQTPMQWAPGAPSLVVKQPGCGAIPPFPHMS